MDLTDARTVVRQSAGASDQTQWAEQYWFICRSPAKLELVARRTLA